VTDDDKVVRVSVTAPHKHAGRWRTIGAEYDTDIANARDLLAVGYAIIVREQPGDKQRYERRDMRPRK
jgi:hypothetical protein